MLLKFKIEKQVIRCTNCNTIVSDSVNFISASFSFDEEWEGYVKTITFTNMTTGIGKSILLDEDSHTCFIPWEVLSEEGEMQVYAEGAYSGSIATTASMKYPISIVQSGKDDCGCGHPPLTPDLYQQIMDKLSNIQIGMVSPELIDDSVDQYFIENPINAIEKDNTEEYIPTEDYHPATKKYVDDTVDASDFIQSAEIDDNDCLVLTFDIDKKMKPALEPEPEPSEQEIQ